MVKAKNIRAFCLLFAMSARGYSEDLPIPGTNVLLNLKEVATPNKYFNSYRIINHVGDIEIDFKHMNVTEYCDKYLNYLKSKNINDVKILLEESKRRILKFQKPNFDNIINIILIIGDDRGTYGVHATIPITGLDDDVVEKIDSAFNSGSLLESDPYIDIHFPFYKFMVLSKKIVSFSSDRIELDGGQIASLQDPLIRKYNIRVLAWNRNINVAKALLNSGETQYLPYVVPLKALNTDYNILKVKIINNASNEIRYCISRKQDGMLALVSVQYAQLLKPISERMLDNAIKQITFSD